MQTGGMIALAPSNPKALELEGGESAEELHVTLWFLGEAADIPPEVQQAILDGVGDYAANTPAIEAQAFGAAVWNPGGDDPCCVLNVGGEGMADARAETGEALDTAGEASDWAMPDNHTPWAAHMCLAYADDPAPLMADALERVGPVTLDRIRVAFGDEVHDFELAAPSEDDQAHETTDDDEDPEAVTAADAPNTGGRTMRRWSGVIAREGVQTGDGRVFAEGAFYWDGTGPWPLRWDREDDGMHLGAVVVGNVETIERRDGGVIWGAGTIDDQGEHGAEAVRLMEERILRGVSVDPDDWAVTVIDTTMTEADLEEAEAELMAMLAAAGEPDPGPDAGVVIYEDEAGSVVERFTRARVRALTLVDVPAFADAEITLEPADAGEDEDDEEDDGQQDEEEDDDMDALSALVASVIGSTDLPIADRDTSWDGSAAAGRVFDMCTDGDSVDVDCVSRAFLWRDPDADAQTKGAYSLGFADVVNDQLQIIPGGVAACAGGRGVDAADIPGEDKDAIKSRICTLYGRIQNKYDDWPDCPFSDSSESADTEAATTAASHNCGCGGTCGGCQPAVVAATGPPPADWFNDPQLTAPTPITVSDPDPKTGWRRVFGHVARHDTCHVGLAGCVTAPTSARGYQDFHRYTHTASGLDLPVAAGRITGGHGRFVDACACCPGSDDHACRNISLGAAIAHHDQMAPLAYVRAGEDHANNAIWVSGVVAPEATDLDVALLSRRTVSGDWREVAGQHELAEVLALSRERPGFPIALVAHGRVVALIGAGALVPAEEAESGTETTAPAALDADAVADVVMRRLDQREAAPHRRKLAALGADHAGQRERAAAERARSRLRSLT